MVQPATIAVVARSMRRIVVGISGATGAIYGIRLLEALRKVDVESHLVITRSGKRTIMHETNLKLEDVRSLADVYYASEDIGAAISSGSFRTMGMVVAPCSIRSRRRRERSRRMSRSASSDG